MTSKKLKAAEDAAKLFLKRALEARVHSKETDSGIDHCGGNHATGALRRASMELSRALIELRKS